METRYLYHAFPDQAVLLDSHDKVVSNVSVVDDVLQSDPRLGLHLFEELQVVLFGQAGYLLDLPLGAGVGVDEVCRDSNRHLAVQTLPREPPDRDPPAGGGDDHVVLLPPGDGDPVLPPHLGHGQPAPAFRGRDEGREGLSSADSGSQDEDHLEEDHLEHPDADVVDRPISELRVELLGSKTSEVLHDEGPELDHVVPVHGVSGLNNRGPGPQQLGLYRQPQPAGSSPYKVSLARVSRSQSYL